MSDQNFLNAMLSGKATLETRGEKVLAAYVHVLKAELDEARYAARLLEHAYQHDSRPSSEALQIVRGWGKK